MNPSSKERTTAIVALCFELDRERDADERRNILRTLEEIRLNEPIDLPTQDADELEP